MIGGDLEKKVPNERMEREFAAFFKDEMMLKNCLRLVPSETGMRSIAKSSFFAGAEVKRTMMVEDIAAIMIDNMNFMQNQDPAKDFGKFFESLQAKLKDAITKVALEDVEPKEK